MNINCFLLIGVLGLRDAVGLTLRSEQAHEYTGHVAHDLFNVYEIFQTFQLIGIIVVMILIGACCFYFRGFFSGQGRSAENVVIVQSSSNRVGNPAPANPRGERLEYQPPRQEVSNSNPILDHFASQKPGALAASPVEVIKDTSSPYATVDKLLKWEPVGQTSITSCAVCNLFNKSNSIPIIQVECVDDHCFHVKCLSDHRSKAVLERAGNGLNKCPKCKQNYSPVVKIYCPNCKSKAISVNLVTFSNTDTGEINTTEIVDKYGYGCENCRNI